MCYNVYIDAPNLRTFVRNKTRLHRQKISIAKNAELISSNKVILNCSLESRRLFTLVYLTSFDKFRNLKLPIHGTNMLEIANTSFRCHVI